jgi:hypothetical protein
VQKLPGGRKRNKKKIESIYDILKMPMSDDIRKEHDAIREKYGLPPIKNKKPRRYKGGAEVAGR